MLAILRDLLRYNREFACGAVLLAFVLIIAGLSFFSPYAPNDVYLVPPDVPPSWAYPLGTTSRGQDTFWQLTFAIRNTLAFGFSVALLSRILSLIIGLLSGYLGGAVDRVLMSINDTFIVIPLFPILVLFYFVMRDDMTLGTARPGHGRAGLGLRRPADPFGHHEPQDPRVHREQHLFWHDHAPDRHAGAPAVCAADRVLDHHEQHQLVDRPRGDPFGARLHQHQHADHRRA